ncbi:MAG: Glycosyl transferase family protein [Candidatus Tokpelaia hoelldobleri]|uniref:Glycosyl transferase family protein n=1 Tax=Candidatus Tokpelaia hoelldobleri TaxID=1902579 RepID=A0A1U9JTF1_9HYPH|nr:MAG: Glycosyl transferase family protein [Candidatus Tokpelaia hoelldoblerii]
MFLSIAIPCHNEAGNLDLLLDEIVAAMSGRDYEILVIDDGSTDNTADIIRARAKTLASLRFLQHDKAAGQSAALRTAAFAARGKILLTRDGDGQNDPAYLPQLADALTAAGESYGIAAGQRLKRTDTRLKQLSSRFANGLRRAILKDDTRDTGCGLKAIYTELFRRLPFFNGWHRYLPALVLREGYHVTHIDVVDRSRRHGQSKYGIFDRAAAGILDLIGVWWLRRRCKRVPEVQEISLDK